jgi:hypothetical protein
MAVHRRALEHYARTNRPDAYRLYARCLLDTFGPEYVDHVERWLRAEAQATRRRVEIEPAGKNT